MKKILLLLTLISFSSIINAQVKVNQNAANSAINTSSAFMDASSSPLWNGTTNQGKGMLYPRVDLVNYTAMSHAGPFNASNNPNYFDGLLVFNTAIGIAGIGADSVFPGYYYYRNTTTTANGGHWVSLKGIKGDDGAIGPFGPQGVTGATGATGNTGPAGPTGSAGGTAGQNIFSVYGTSTLAVSSLGSWILVPGLTQTLTISAGTQLLISTHGGFQTTSMTSGGYSKSDVALFIDGVGTPGGLRRVTASNSAGVVAFIANWDFSTGTTLSAGSHTFEIKVKYAGGSSYNVSGDNTSVLQSALNVLILKN